MHFKTLVGFAFLPYFGGQSGHCPSVFSMCIHFNVDITIWRIYQTNISRSIEDVCIKVIIFALFVKKKQTNKKNSRRKVLSTYVDISIWPSLEGGVSGCCRDNNKLAFFHLWVCCPEIVSLNQFTGNSTWGLKNYILHKPTNFYNPHRHFFPLKQYCLNKGIWKNMVWNIFSCGKLGKI